MGTSPLSRVKKKKISQHGNVQRYQKKLSCIKCRDFIDYLCYFPPSLDGYALLLFQRADKLSGKTYSTLRLHTFVTPTCRQAIAKDVFNITFTHFCQNSGGDNAVIHTKGSVRHEEKCPGGFSARARAEVGVEENWAYTSTISSMQMELAGACSSYRRNIRSGLSCGSFQTGKVDIRGQCWIKAWSLREIMAPDLRKFRPKCP